MPSKEQSKLGLDDYLVANGAKSFGALAEDADELIHWAVSSVSNEGSSAKRFAIEEAEIRWLFSRLASLPQFEVMQISKLASKACGLTKSDFNKLLKNVPAWRPNAPKAQREQASKQREAEKSRKKTDEQRRQSAAMRLAQDPAILHRAIKLIGEFGVAGEQRNIGIVRLAVRSRALRRPVNVQVHSASSTGKTHVVHSTLMLEHESSFYELTSSSEKALIYLEDSLEHRLLYIQEPEGLAGGVGAAAMKSLIWEGRLNYDTVVQQDGVFVTQHIEKDGPTGLIITTTRDLEEQISNRMFRIELDSSNEQTRRILRSIASDAEGSSSGQNLEAWIQFSKLTGEAAEVVIPYASWLSERVSIGTLRIRRDFTQLLNFIRACAVEHRFQREKQPDGILLATTADYAMAHVLVADLFQVAQAEGITESDRLFLKAVAECSDLLGKAPSQADLVRHTKASKATVSYRTAHLLSLGYLENHEEKKGRAAQLVPGTPMPDPVPPLPSPCELSAYLVSADRAELVQSWVHPISGEPHDCREHPNGQPATASRGDGKPFTVEMNGPEHPNGSVQPFTTVQAHYERSTHADVQGVLDDRSSVQSETVEDVLEI